MTNYNLLTEQITALIQDESDCIANLSNCSAALNEALDNINWVGFYIVKEDQLVLGPFQGKVACVRIPFSRGVCGACVREKAIQRVADVHSFKDHIACDCASNSEIVLPLFKNEEVVAVLDIDSPIFNRFSEEDEKGLKKIASIIQNCF